MFSTNKGQGSSAQFRQLFGADAPQSSKSTIELQTGTPSSLVPSPAISSHRSPKSDALALLSVAGLPRSIGRRIAQPTAKAVQDPNEARSASGEVRPESPASQVTAVVGSCNTRGSETIAVTAILEEITKIPASIPIQSQIVLVEDIIARAKGALGWKSATSLLNEGGANEDLPGEERSSASPLKRITFNAALDPAGVTACINGWSTLASLYARVEPARHDNAIKLWQEVLAFCNATTHGDSLVYQRANLELGVSLLQAAFEDSDGSRSVARGRACIKESARALCHFADLIAQQKAFVDERYYKIISAQLSAAVQTLSELGAHREALRVGAAAHAISAAFRGQTARETLEIVVGITQLLRRLERDRLVIALGSSVQRDGHFATLSLEDRLRLQSALVHSKLKIGQQEDAWRFGEESLRSAGVLVTADGCVESTTLSADERYAVSLIMGSLADHARRSADWRTARIFADAAFEQLQGVVLEYPEACYLAGIRSIEMWACIVDRREIEGFEVKQSATSAEEAGAPDRRTALRRLAQLNQALSQIDSGREYLQLVAQEYELHLLTQFGEHAEAHNRAGALSDSIKQRYGSGSKAYGNALITQLRCAFRVGEYQSVKDLAQQLVELGHLHFQIDPEVVLDGLWVALCAAQSRAEFIDAEGFATAAKQFAARRFGKNSLEFLRALADEASYLCERGLTERDLEVLHIAFDQAADTRSALEALHVSKEREATFANATRGVVGSIMRCYLVEGSIWSREAESNKRLSDATEAARSFRAVRRLGRAHNLTGTQVYLEATIGRARMLLLAARLDHDGPQILGECAIKLFRWSEAALRKDGSERSTTYENVLTELIECFELLDRGDSRGARIARKRLRALRRRDEDSDFGEAR